ncbi:MAG: drug/metabolite transporter, family, partial [Nocardioidaceae bacterium]|nr:drug/metabolite transporter, family [Nocardioidaceae bacterium]
MSDKAHAGTLYVVGGAALFGTIGTARLLGPSAPETSVASVRLAIAAVLLLALASRHGLGSLGAAWRLGPVWVAGLAQAAFNVTFLSAVTQAGVAVGTLVAIGCTPILTGLLSRHITRAWVGATAMAITGLVLLLSQGLGHGVSLAGLAWALGASLCYATYITASTALAPSELKMETKLTAIFVIAAVCLSPALVLSPPTWLASGSGVAMVLYLAVATNVMAYSLFNRGLRTVAPGTAATLALTEPLIAAVLGVVVLGERLSTLSWLGAAVVLVALFVMIRVAGAPAPVRPPVPSGRKSAVERAEMSPRAGGNVPSNGRKCAVERAEMSPRAGENVASSGSNSAVERAEMSPRAGENVRD